MRGRLVQNDLDVLVTPDEETDEVYVTASIPIDALLRHPHRVVAFLREEAERREAEAEKKKMEPIPHFRYTVDGTNGLVVSVTKAG